MTESEQDKTILNYMAMSQADRARAVRRLIARGALSVDVNLKLILAGLGRHSHNRLAYSEWQPGVK